MQIPCGGVAFFDSGIGGLTVLAECRKYVTNEIFYYYGDNLRAPYGNLSPERIFAYVDEAFALFARLKVKAAVLACNTATAVCVERLRKKYPFPVIGAEPAVLPAAKVGGKILVLSTCATGQSARFARLCERVRKTFPQIELTVAPCPSLAGEIEKHVLDDGYSYAPFLPPATPTSVVLGCTHYIYAKEQIQSFYGCPVFDGNAGISRRLQDTLLRLQKTFFSPNGRDERPLLTTARPPQNFFLGAKKMQNKLVFEQMFGK